MLPVYLWSNSTENNSIKVFVRVRPLIHGTGLTTDGDHNLCLTVTSPNTIRLLSKPEPRTFTYDHVADMDTSQVHILLSKLPLKRLSLLTKCDFIYQLMLIFIVIAFVISNFMLYLNVLLQDAVFSSVAKNIVESCINGYNGTIFA